MKPPSTALLSLAYDCTTQELTVVFNDRTSYRYFGVPEHIHQSLLSAQSKGRFFNLEIRNRYPYRKLPPEMLFLS